MNQNQLQGLTSNLSQALDQNYDVVNMDAVLAVLRALEGTTITKEQLEATRLAKYINLLRRRTHDEHLARRAKSLLKKWREMLGIQSTIDIHQTSQNSCQTANNRIQVDQNATRPVGPILQYSQSPISIKLQESPKMIAPNFPSFHTGLETKSANNLTMQNNPTAMDDLPSNFAETANIQPHQSNFSAITTNTSNEHKYQNKIKVDTFINDNNLSNSESNFSNIEKLNEAIVIDIVSDSDEDKPPLKLYTTTDVISSVPVTCAARSKKLKKEKKRKEKSQTQHHKTLDSNVNDSAQKDNVEQAFDPTKATQLTLQVPAPNDSEILALSNSSISSILSGDNALESSRVKSRNAATSELTFAGKFNNANHSTILNTNTNSQNSASMPHNDTPPSGPGSGPGLVTNLITNDASSSCSRFSIFEDIDSKSKIEFADSQHSRPLLSINVSSSTMVFDAQQHMLAQQPKKRGRKKGSKGVDSIIARESSLSHQIFFGSGVKKVKTTKELFNEIQNRKSNTVFNAFNVPSQHLQQLQTRTLQSRPTSSCSETSLPSPLPSEPFSASLGDVADKLTSNEGAVITDSNSNTSDQSHDSLKSRELKCNTTSLDSNSNSIPFSSLEKSKPVVPRTIANVEITSEFAELLENLGQEATIEKVEYEYQRQIVPCTCVIIEELPNLPQNNEISIQGNNNVLFLEQESPNCSEIGGGGEKHDIRTTHYINPPNSSDEIVQNNAQKPVKSIFDLDFDEDDDPLNTLMETLPTFKSFNNDNNVQTAAIVQEIKDEPKALMATIEDKVAQVDLVQQELISIYKVHENPNCVAKQYYKVQTDEVTDFHINTLHNYYVPHINGNWASDKSSVVINTEIDEFISSLDSYSVSDGADVVPKYGSLNYERIKKNLCNFSSSDNKRRVTHETNASYMTTPFLGVAKCLPSNQSKLQLNNDEEVSTKNKMVKNHKIKKENQTSPEFHLNNSSYCSSVCSSLTSNNDSDILRSNARKREKDKTTIKRPEGKENSQIYKRTKIEVEDLQVPEMVSREDHCVPSSINLNVHESCWQSENVSDVDQTVAAKLSETESWQSETSTMSDDEELVENTSLTYNNDEFLDVDEEYAVVKKSVNTGSKHIVLTIKKTPSKLNNVTTNSKPSASSDDSCYDTTTTPIAYDDSPKASSSNVNNNMTATDTQQQMEPHGHDGYDDYATSKINSFRKRYRQQRHKLKCEKQILDIELKHLFNNYSHDSVGSSERQQQQQVKMHRKLFFHEELCIHDLNGDKHRVINYSSSSSSSSSGDSNFGDDSDTEDGFIGLTTTDEKVFSNNNNLENETDAHHEDHNEKRQINDCLSQTDDCGKSIAECHDAESSNAGGVEIDDEKISVYETALSLANNGRLLSFSYIYPELRAKAKLEDILQIKNHDDAKLYNNNLFEGILSTSCGSNTTNVTQNICENHGINRSSINSKDTSAIQPDLEYQIGMRPVVTNEKRIKGNGTEESSNTIRMQEFKEWHQVLRLQSYNDEPLTVLPYVVLE